MRRHILVLLVLLAPSPALAQTSPRGIPECTIAQLVAGTCVAPRVGNRARVTNAISPTSCGTGGGTDIHICEWDGASWTTPGAGQAADVSLWANAPAVSDLDMSGNAIADADSVSTTCVGGATNDCHATLQDNAGDPAAPADGVRVYSKADEPWSRAVGGAAKALCLEDGTNCPAGTVLPTFVECFTVYAPNELIAAGNDIQSLWRAPANVTVTQIWCETSPATATVTSNLQRDDGSPVDISTADVVCDDGGELSAALTGTEDNVAAGERIDLDVVSVANSPTRLSYCLRYTYD